MRALCPLLFPFIYFFTYYYEKLLTFQRLRPRKEKDMIEIKGREDEMDILIQRKIAELERETHAPWITQSVGPTGFRFTRVDEEGYPDPELGTIPVNLVWED